MKRELIEGILTLSALAALYYITMIIFIG